MHYSRKTFSRRSADERSQLPLSLSFPAQVQRVRTRAAARARGEERETAAAAAAAALERGNAFGLDSRTWTYRASRYNCASEILQCLLVRPARTALENRCVYTYVYTYIHTQRERGIGRTAVELHGERKHTLIALSLSLAPERADIPI